MGAERDATMSTRAHGSQTDTVWIPKYAILCTIFLGGRPGRLFQTGFSSFPLPYRFPASSSLTLDFCLSFNPSLGFTWVFSFMGRGFYGFGKANFSLNFFDFGVLVRSAGF